MAHSECGLFMMCLKIRRKIIKNFVLSIKMVNLLKSKLRSIAKKKVLVVTKVCQKMN